MPANKYALLRYRIIDRCLSNSRTSFPTKETLRLACEEALYGSAGDNISTSTIEKDIWAMRNEGDLGYYAPIVYHPVHKGYYYEDDSYSINKLSLNDEDISALKIAAVTLEQFRDIPVFEQFGSAIDKVIQRLNLRPSIEQKESVIQFETAHSQGVTSMLAPLIEAIERKKVVCISYRKFTDEPKKQYVLHPYLLKEYSGRWYLITWSPKRKDYLTFGLERIQDISTTGESFDKKKSFDADRFFRHSLGITELDEKPIDIELLVTPLQSKYLESRPIHPTLKKKKTSDKGVEFGLKVIPSYELLQWIMSLGADCEVISPASVRKEIASRIAALSATYKAK